MRLLTEPNLNASRWVILAAEMALVLAAASLFQPAESHEKREVQSHEKREVVTGAMGPFPAAFAAEAPVAPDHVIRRTTGDVPVHGLGIRSTDFGVRAVNLRTGKEYWRYEHRYTDFETTAPTFDVLEHTVVIEFRDGNLVGVDLRTGKPRWRKETERRTGSTFVSLADGRAVTDATGAVLAVSERDGRSLWTAKTPRSCADVSVFDAYDFPDHLSTVLVGCNVMSLETRYDLLLGVDNRTGDVLWQRRTEPADSPLRGDDHTLVVPDPAPGTPKTVHLLDVNRDGVSQRADFSVKWAHSITAAGGVAVSNIDPEIYHIDSNTLLSAYDVQDGHVAWRLRAPSGQEYGAPAIADGRVYVVRRPILKNADRGSRTQAELLVLDVDTGRLLHTLRLSGLTVPKDLAYARLDIRDIADGAVSISWLEEDEGKEEDLLIATD
ncbi:outer membrane protein assembly factor BamB family protein [Streptomyces sp. 2A115]|uniref:outer membrane protein assembly factor BamB family protein n=1 Tax=Streptomyces sp. 2A115 TaxID=3457439 RepID=UPI003FD1D051